VGKAHAVGEGCPGQRRAALGERLGIEPGWVRAPERMDLVAGQEGPPGGEFSLIESHYRVIHNCGDMSEEEFDGLRIKTGRGCPTQAQLASQISWAPKRPRSMHQHESRGKETNDVSRR
jgi:hypothetical protein